MRLTADVILRARDWINPARERELDLRGYKIPTIENLGVTQDGFDTIDLSDNEIKKLENFPKMKRLQTLLLNNNHIVRIQEDLGEALPSLETLILSRNKIVNLSEIDAMTSFKKLTKLSLLDNPVCKRHHYREYVIYKLPNLKILDFKKIRPKQRKEAARLFKSTAGKQLVNEVKAEERTFVPGEGLPTDGGPKKLTPEVTAKLKAMIAKAKTPQEVDRLERAIKTGVFDFNLEDGATEKPAPASPSKTKRVSSPDRARADGQSPKRQRTEQGSPRQPPSAAKSPSPRKGSEQAAHIATQPALKPPSPTKPATTLAAAAPQTPTPVPESPKAIKPTSPRKQPTPVETEDSTKSASPRAASPRAPAKAASTPKTNSPHPRSGSAKKTPKGKKAPSTPKDEGSPMEVEGEEEAVEGVADNSLTESQVKKMKVADLKAELSRRNLSTKGLKAELMARLLENL